MSVVTLTFAVGWGFVGGLMVAGMLKDNQKEESAE